MDKERSQSFKRRSEMKKPVNHAILIHHNGHKFDHYYQALRDVCYFSNAQSQQIALLLTVGQKHALTLESEYEDELVPICDLLKHKYKIKSTVVDKDEFCKKYGYMD